MSPMTMMEVAEACASFSDGALLEVLAGRKSNREALAVTEAMMAAIEGRNVVSTLMIRCGQDGDIAFTDDHSGFAMVLADLHGSLQRLRLTLSNTREKYGCHD